MPHEIIESLNNSKVKAAVQLKERRARKKYKKTLIEGYRELYQAIQHGLSIDTIFLCEELFPNQESQKTFDLLDADKIFYVTKKVFEKLSFRSTPDGFIAVADEILYDLLDIPPSPNPFLLVIEKVEKPGNLGAILRTADGAGADAIILCDPATDLNNPNVIRASLGAVFSLPVITMTVDELFLYCESKKIKLIATSPDVKKVYWDTDFTKGVALVLGSEKDGISERFLKESNEVVTIPMLGKVDSLNVSAATSLLSYEVIRQRSMRS
ncbi:MAG: RNA methyltransferase [Bdellovibrionales bacterium]|nr:RNA methyltransferase [Bdellovibrionales bacterium]